jgi:hypothetical protein
MFTPAMILANAKINELHAEAAAQRLAKKSPKARDNSRGAISVAVGTPRSILSTAIENPFGLPTLADYPYRG